MNCFFGIREPQSTAASSFAVNECRERVHTFRSLWIYANFYFIFHFFKIYICINICLAYIVACGAMMMTAAHGHQTNQLCYAMRAAQNVSVVVCGALKK